jgi:N-acetylneuraminate lyase
MLEFLDERSGHITTLTILEFMTREHFTTPSTRLIAAPLTPMHADGSVNLDAIEQLAAKLHRDGVTGAFVCGTTGEGLSLTVDERMQVAERWIEVLPARMRLIVHVSHSALADCRQLMEHAADIGAYGVASMGPIFFRPSSLENLVNYCAEAASTTPDLPFYFYHFPFMSGSHFSMYDFLRFGSKRIPNLAGVKFTQENLADFRRCLTLDEGRFEMLFGRDEMLLGAWAMGARGAVGSTYNFVAPLYHAMIAACEEGDMAAAQRHQSRSIELVSILSNYEFLAAAKAFMTLLGIDCGPVRPPLRRLSRAEGEKLRCALEEGGFLPEEVEERETAVESR